MKTVPWFVLKQFNGDPVKLPDGGDASMKQVFLGAVGGAQIKDGKKAITAYLIGTKIYNTEEGQDLVLEDAEFEILKEAISQSPPQSAVLYGQIWQKILEAEK